MAIEADTIVFDKPIQIARVNSENSSKIIWDRELIKHIFSAKETANLEVAIISIAGAYRQGKSFLLNFFLMFLRALKENNVPSTEWENFEWLHDNQKIEGFEFKAGNDRVTTGIWMWGEPIVLPAGDEKKMAVVLLDTQGAFDFLATTNESKNIFALSTGLSSVQIYNVNKMFQEDQMQHLALFAQCGQAMKQQEKKDNGVETEGQCNIEKKKFQKLLIVIRDHQNDQQYPFGKEGGKMLVEDALREHDNGINNPDATLVRKYIKESFETIEGFNLPDPGKDVMRQTKMFDGAVSKIDEEFKEFAKKLVVDTMLFAIREPKCVNGVPITCDFMPLLFEQLVIGCEKQQIIRGICDAIENIELSQVCTTAATKSMEYYLAEMALACTNRISSEEQLNEISEKAMDNFLKETESVSEPNHHIRKQHEEELASEMKKLHESYTACEEPKRISHTLLGLVWWTIIFIEQCIPILDQSKKNRSTAKLVAPVIAQSSHLALTARFGTETIASIMPFAKVAGTPLLVISLGIDAYDTFALIRDFKKPSEMSEHLEKKVLPEFTNARFHLSRELNRKLGVPNAMEIIERKREDISRRESLPPPFTEDRITLRTRNDSIY
uniref:GB1/RHD3-type G domain-containing protein n=1 Tax=Plectus sambesii TaxID=2011161 RepID=A0A914WGP7_9BILA